MPILLDNQRLSGIDNIVCRGSIKQFSEGDIVAPETGDVIAEFDFAKHIRDSGLLALPAEFKTTFNTIGPDFSQLFLNNPAIDDEESIIKYALHLKNLLTEGDVDALFGEFKNKLLDFSNAYFEDPGINRDLFYSSFEEDLAPENLILSYRDQDIIVLSWCEGRIWEIRIKPDLPFIQSREDSEGNSYSIHVFVAIVEGQIRVIR